jgi:hypothetical protein
VPDTPSSVHGSSLARTPVPLHEVSSRLRDRAIRASGGSLSACGTVPETRPSLQSSRAAEHHHACSAWEGTAVTSQAEDAGRSGSERPLCMPTSAATSAQGVSCCLCLVGAHVKVLLAPIARVTSPCCENGTSIAEAGRPLLQQAELAGSGPARQNGLAPSLAAAAQSALPSLLTDSEMEDVAADVQPLGVCQRSSNAHSPSV